MNCSRLLNWNSEEFNCISIKKKKPQKNTLKGCEKISLHPEPETEPHVGANSNPGH